MSWQCTSWALREAPCPTATSRLVLLALADRCQPDGRSAWPTVETLMLEAHAGESSVRRALKALEVCGAIRRGEQRLAQWDEHGDWLPEQYRPVVWECCMGVSLERVAAKPGRQARHEREERGQWNAVGSPQSGNGSSDSSSAGNVGNRPNPRGVKLTGLKGAAPAQGCQNDTPRPVTGDTPIRNTNTLITNNPSASFGGISPDGETPADDDGSAGDPGDGWVDAGRQASDAGADAGDRPGVDAAAVAPDPTVTAMIAADVVAELSRVSPPSRPDAGDDADRVCSVMVEGLSAEPVLPVPRALRVRGVRERRAAGRLIARHGLPVVLAVARWASQPVPPASGRSVSGGRSYDGFWRRTLTGVRMLETHWDQVCLQMADDPAGRRLLADRGMLARNPGEPAMPPAATRDVDAVWARVDRLLELVPPDAGNDGFVAQRTLRRLLDDDPSIQPGSPGEQRALTVALRAGGQRQALMRGERERHDAELAARRAAWRRQGGGFIGSRDAVGVA